MKISMLVALIACGLLLASCRKEKEDAAELKVMSFNIWMGGGKSISETGEVIVRSGADIVGVQEAAREGKNTAAMLADSLGWYCYTYGGNRAVVSKYPIVDTSANHYGVRIAIDSLRSVWMFNVHLIHCPYEPYQLNGIEYCGAPMLSTADEAVRSALTSRGPSVAECISDILAVRAEGWPVFLTGDFNEPSYLDWTPRAAEAGLCKLAVEWPSTQAFTHRGAMRDSYRERFPDEVASPGHTWTTIPETEAYAEVPDRIDFVFYSGEKVKLTDSQIVGEPGGLSDMHLENYPSDHRAVLSTFEVW